MTTEITRSDGISLISSSKHSSNVAAAAPDWARQAVRSAYGLGLVQGRSGEQFAPIGLATRAESTKAMHQLWTMLQKD
ncbi:S-layer homology domain-containing protein [Paenibacillus sp. MER TA 81-3]|uniref:S-layer homology domain-containing protein n=1 Tax=Paenibacillus sp. MER TA 81-3 TaxID=2939573 RepID=UPI0034D98608